MQLKCKHVFNYYFLLKMFPRTGESKDITYTLVVDDDRNRKPEEIIPIKSNRSHRRTASNNKEMNQLLEYTNRKRRFIPSGIPSEEYEPRKKTEIV